VGKSFPAAGGPVHVLHAVDLYVEHGEFVALTGPSGSGKSTCLNLAGLLDQPTEGELLLEGDDTCSLSERALCELRKRKVGMVFQGFHLLPHRTVLENVMFRFRYLDVSIDEAREHALRALAAVGLGGITERSARLLSGGEMQRVAIARAVALRPGLLLADEPTGNLDRDATDVVMETFAELNREGIGILLATHNPDLLKYCGREVVCRDGTLSDGRTL
jgi:ABC-type lipoprotein export system ATPase subunit